MKGNNGELISSMEFEEDTLISPKLDFTEIIASSVLLEVMVTLLSIEQSIAFFP